MHNFGIANISNIPGISSIEGFTCQDSSNKIINTTTNQPFLPTNRSWQHIDRAFDGLPSLCVRKMADSTDYDTPLAVLDIGAGLRRRASEELQQARRIGRHVAVTGVDAVMQPDSYTASQVLGDFFALPIPDASYDLVYSRQSISVAGAAKPDLLAKALGEATRVMKTDGVAFFDVDPRQSEYQAGFETIEKATDVSWFLGRSGSFGRLLATLQGFGDYHRRENRGRFLIASRGLGSALIESLATKGKDIEAV